MWDSMSNEDDQFVAEAIEEKLTVRGCKWWEGYSISAGRRRVSTG